MFDLNTFKDPKRARKLIGAIEAVAPEHATLMEVCGTHTVSIARFGIRNVMPAGTRLASGPGCPVCVTANEDIDVAIALARTPDAIITTFGDMTRVPGSTSSLNKEKAQGRDIRVVYSPLDALAIAKANPDRQVIFLGVGFETTTPLVAIAIKRAKAEGLANFSVYAACKNMPNALDVLMGDPELKVDALILPGHVSTIIGMKPYLRRKLQHSPYWEMLGGETHLFESTYVACREICLALGIRNYRGYMKYLFRDYNKL